MSQLEELILSAEEHGKRNQLFEEVRKIRERDSGKYAHLTDIYQEAYEIVMKQ